MLLEASDLRLSLPDFNQRAVSGRRARIEILKSVSLQLSPGEAVGLVGESGSGKSSLGRTLVRLHEPTAAASCSTVSISAIWTRAACARCGRAFR